MPDEIPASSLDSYLPRPCPCKLEETSHGYELTDCIKGIAFTQCHPKPDSARTTPFYNVSTHAASFYHDPPTAEKSVRTLAEFDSDPRILVLIAHDVAPLNVMNFFPNGTINDWRRKGWKEQLHWGFLNELPVKGKTHRQQLVDGLYANGQKIRGLELPAQ